MCWLRLSTPDKWATHRDRPWQDHIPKSAFQHRARDTRGLRQSGQGTSVDHLGNRQRFERSGLGTQAGNRVPQPRTKVLPAQPLQSGQPLHQAEARPQPQKNHRSQRPCPHQMPQNKRALGALCYRAGSLASFGITQRTNGSSVNATDNSAPSRSSSSQPPRLIGISFKVTSDELSL
jgi:hypothetical protein